MKKLILAISIILSLTIQTSLAQSFVWAENITGTSYQIPQDVVVDDNGANYSCGWSIGNSTFGNITISGVSYDGWLAKYDVNGDEQWALRLGGSSYDGAFEVDRDAHDGVYVSGWFYGTFSVGDTTVTGTTSDYDAFLVKVDTNGNFKWIKTMTGSGITRPVGMAVDDDGDVYVQLGYVGSFTAGSSALSSTANSTYWNNAIVKYDSAGNFQWKTNIEGDHYINSSWYWSYAGGVDVDGSGNPYCIGTFLNTDTFKIGTTTLLSNGAYDAYLAKFNPNTGAATWAVRGGGTSWEYGTGLSIDGSNRIFISGYNYSGNSSFGSISLTSSGPYWIRYNTSGSAQSGMVGSGVCYDNEIETDADGNLYMCGLMNTNINLALGGVTVTNPTGSSYTPYYFKYDYINTTTDFLIRPTSSSSTEYSVALDASTEDMVVATGSYFGTVVFSNTSLSSTSYDGYLTRIANCEDLIANAYSLGGDSVCAGETLTLQADTSSLYDYQWLYNGAVISGEVNETYTTGTAGSYSVVIDSIGCLDTSDAITVTVNALPNVTHSNFSSVCDGDDPFTLTGGNPTGGVYSGTGVTGGTTFDPGAAATGNNIITYTYTDANGCADSVSKTITVQQSPAIFTTTISACEDDAAISLNTSSYGFPTGGTHSGTGVSGTSFSPSNAGAGTHTIYYTSSNGCVSPDSIVATVNASPNVTLGSFADKCVTASGFALTGGSPSGGTYSGLGVFGSFYYPAFAGAGTHSIVYTVTSSGCTASDTSTITVDPVPSPSIATLPDLCEADDTLGLSPYGSPTGGSFSGTGVSSNIFDPSVSGVGTFTMTYSYTNACGTYTDTESITVNDSPTITITSTNVSCNGGSNGSATAAGSGTASPYSYSWSTGASVATATGLTAGTFTVTVTDNNGCTDTESVTITEPSALSASATASAASCNGGNDGIVSAFASGGTTAYTYAWNTGSTSTIVTGLTAGNYTVTVTDANGCTETATATVSEPTSVVASISGSNVSCNGGSDGSATASATGGTGTKTFVWSTGATTATTSSLAAGTYTVTATDGNGCTDTETVTITEPSALVASTSVDDNVSCNGGSDGGATASASGGTTAYSYSWSTGGTSASVTGLAAGTYTVTVTDANGCTDTETVTITQPATAVSVSIAGTNASCNGVSDGSATATGSGGTGSITYAWSNSGTGATVTGLAAGTYTVTATDANGCTDTESVTITEPTAVSVTIASTNATCNGATDGTATATGSGGTGTITYAWSNSGTGATVTGLAAGTYTVTATDANGCTETESVTITAPTAVTASISGSNVSCNGGNDGSATASASGGSGSFSYAWSTGATSATATSLTAGTYTVTATDGNGCTDTETVTITEPSALVASTSVDDNVSCNGGSDGGATASASGGTTAYSYSWSTGGTSASVTGLAAGTYTVTVTDANGCTDTETVTITQPATAVSVSIAGTNASCNGVSDGSATATGSGGTGSITYAWSNSGTGVTVTGLAAGTYTVTATDANGCTDTESVTITEPTAVSVTIASTNATCNGATDGTATATGSGGTGTITYAWSNSGTGATVTGLAAGTYTVTATDANGCTETESVTITAPTAVTASISGSNVSCNGGNDGSATASASGGSGSFSYAWSTGATSATATTLTAGTYTVTATDGNGCTDTETVTITEPSALVASTSVDDNVSCNGGSDGGATASASGGTTAYSYSWSTGGTSASVTGLAAGTYTVTVTDANSCTDTETVTITEPATAVSVSIAGTNASCNGVSDGSATATGSGGTGSITYAWSNSGTGATVTGLAAGTYTVTATDANGCTDTESVTITEPTAVSVTIASTNATCNGATDGTATATGSGGTGTITYAWSNSGTGATVTGLAAGTYTVTATDANGCTETESVTITAPTAVTASISGSNVSCNGGNDGSATASASGGSGSFSYAWSTGATSATATTLTAGTYTVTATDGNGCTDTETVTITEPSALVASTSVDDNVSCNGGSDGGATASASGGTTAYSYSWSTGGTSASVTGLAAGTYTVTVTDANSCTDTETVTITEPATAVSVSIAGTNASCNGVSDGSATATGSGGTGSITYAWSNSGTGATITGLLAGTYSVTATDANGCTDSASVLISEPTSIVASTVVDSNTSCNGSTDGGATASATGGTGSYTYSWSNSATTASITGVAAGTYSVTITDANGCTDSSSVMITEPNSIVASTAVDSNVSCNGSSDGGATASATGGTGTYTYAWSNSATTASITGIAAGTYSVTVTDANGCTDSTSVIIIQPTSLIAATALDSNVSCNGASDGAATASATGGTTAYTYAWSNSATTASITGVVAGTYSVTITDANGCTDSASVTIIAPTGVIAAAVLDSNVSCNSGSDGGATASANGGTAGYTYSWSNSATTASITGVAAGTYSVTVTDANGCTDSTSVTIAEPTAVVAASVVDSNTSCNGSTDGGATASATGGTGSYTYSWSNSATTASITGVAAGTYSVTITDANGCTDSSSVTITAPASVVATTVVDSNVSCNGSTDGGATASATGGTGSYTYAWSNSATTASITGIAAGTYSVTVTDANGCTDSTSVIIIQPTSLIAATALDSNVSCNGASDGAATASATGGTTAYTYAWSNSATTASISGVLAGTYSVTVTDANGCTDSTSIIITEPTALFATAAVDSNTSCSSASTGVASVVATGGTAGYTYNWTNGATTTTANNLSSGWHVVTVTDANGCTAVDSIEIDVNDTIVPTVISQNITVYLDAAGDVSIDTGMVNNGSFDNCAIDSMYLDMNDFDCSDTGANTVSLTVIDINGNVNSASAIVTVVDSIAPTLSYNGSFTLYLNASGQASISINDVNTGTSDNCSIASLSISDSIFNCADTGSQTITFTAIDVNGNVSNANVSITIVDTIAPTVATQNITVSLNSFGQAVISAAMIDDGSFDNCSIDTMYLSDTIFECDSLGGNAVTLYVIDASGNMDSAGAIVTVVDSLPVELNTYVSVDVYLSAGGFVEIDSSMVDSASADNCGIASITLSQDTLWCGDVPSTTVLVTAMDFYGNISTANVLFNVWDTIAPAVASVDTMGYLNTNGQFTVTASMLDSGSADACGIDSVWLSQSIFTCGDIGMNTVWFYAVDVNGNVDSTMSMVTILDTLSVVDVNIDSNLLCYGAANGQLTATASGMVSTFTYAWSNSSTGSTISNLVGGTYIVTSTDANGCTAIDSATLVDPTQLVGSFIAFDVTCFGANDGTIISSISGGTPGYSYSWSNSATTGTISSLSGGLYELTVTDTNGCELTWDTTLSEPTQLLANISFIDSSLCANDSSGTAIAIASGGTPGYTYLWTASNDTLDTITGIPAGTYTVIITDTNGCVASDTQSITQDTLPLVTLNVPEDSLCQFNAITLTGQTPLGGMFSGNGVLADTLTTDSLTEWNWVNYAFIDANGCSGSATDSIYITPTADVTFSMNPIELCGGTSVALDFASPDGGVYGGEASIIDNLNGLLVAPDSAYAGTGWYGYSNVCGSDTDTFSFIVIERPDVDLGGDVVLCNASLMTFDAGIHNSVNWFNGSTSQTITINDGEEPLEVDFDLWVTVGDTNGCIDSDTIRVVVEDQPTFYLGDNIEACIKDSVLLTVDNVYDNFTWSTGDVGLTTVAHDGSSIMPGVYSFWVKGTNDAGECSYSDTIKVLLEDCDSSFVGIEDPILELVSFEVYPNPTRGYLNIRGSQLSSLEIDQITVMGMRGEIAKTYNPSEWSEVSSEEMQINMSTLADGVYMMRIDHAKGSNVVRVIVGR